MSGFSIWRLSELAKTVGTAACPVSDRLFMEKLKNIGKLAGLNENKINNCFKDEQIVDNIINTRNFAERKYNISSTPSFIINNKKYSAMSYENFEKIIENLINWYGLY